MMLRDAFEQGQRDREQGWPPNAGIWGFEGRAASEYMRGYGQPRIDPKAYPVLGHRRAT